MGKSLIVIGVVVALLGALLVLTEKLGLPALGRLPGDFSWRSKGWTISFPLASMIVISLLLSITVWLVGIIRR